MSWARYDDEFPMNKKVGRLVGKGQQGVAAIGLHLLANTYARHNGTAGLIESHVPNLLCGPRGRTLAKLLQEVGMFDPHPDGWTIHDYAEFHDPNDPDPDKSAADRKKELSEKRAEAGRLGGLAKAKQSPSKASDLPQAKGVAKPWQSPSPDPDPDPDLTTGTNHHPSYTGGPDDDERFRAIVEALADDRIKRHPARDNPLKYRTTVVASVIDQQGDAIRSFLASFHPDADADQALRRIRAERRIS